MMLTKFKVNNEKKRRTSSEVALVIFFLLTSNQVNIFASTVVATVEDIFVSFVMTQYENNYGFVLSSKFLPVTSKNYSKLSKSHRNGLKCYLPYKTVFAIK